MSTRPLYYFFRLDTHTYRESIYPFTMEGIEEYAKTDIEPTRTFVKEHKYKVGDFERTFKEGDNVVECRNWIVNEALKQMRKEKLEAI